MRKNKQTYKLSPKDKATILARVAAGDQPAQIARDYEIDRSTIAYMIKRSSQTLAQVETSLLASQTEIQQRLLAKSYIILEKKLDTLQKPTELKKARIDHISSVNQDLWKQTQVESGKPTDITSTKDTSELTVYLQTNIQRLEELVPIEVLSEGYNTPVSSPSSV